MYYGTPTVTLPSNYLKARIVKGAYDQMKLENSPVANTIDEYVDLSVEIANLDKKKATLSIKLLEELHNKEAVSKLSLIHISEPTRPY